MKNSLLLNSNTDNLKKVEKYIFNYLNELKIHFSMSDYQIIDILNSAISKLKKNSKKKSLWTLLVNYFSNTFN